MILGYSNTVELNLNLCWYVMRNFVVSISRLVFLCGWMTLIASWTKRVNESCFHIQTVFCGGLNLLWMLHQNVLLQLIIY